MQSIACILSRLFYELISITFSFVNVYIDDAIIKKNAQKLPCNKLSSSDTFNLPKSYVPYEQVCMDCLIEILFETSRNITIRLSTRFDENYFLKRRCHRSFEG